MIIVNTIGIEIFLTIKDSEYNLLKQIRERIIKELLMLPKPTQYYPLLLETGILTIMAKAGYKNLILCHNLSVKCHLIHVKRYSPPRANQDDF